MKTRFVKLSSSTSENYLLLFLFCRDLTCLSSHYLFIQLRAESELKDTAKQYLWSLLKKECWDEMTVKGRHILGFHTIFDVANYPMRQRGQEEMAELDYATQCLEIERIERSSRLNALPPETASYDSLIGNNIHFICYYLFSRLVI